MHLGSRDAGRSILTHADPGSPDDHHVRFAGSRDGHLGPRPRSRRGLAPRPRQVPARRVPMRSVRAAAARGPLPRRALGEACGRRDARPDDHPPVRGLPEGHRRGPAVVAAIGARGAGGRRAQLRARDDGLGRRAGRDAEDADLRHDVLSGLPRHPGPVRAGRPALVRRRPADHRGGAPARRPAGRHRLLLHLERPDLRQRRGLRERSAPLPAPGRRARRRRLARVAVARSAALRRSRDVPARGGRVAGRPPRDLGRRSGRVDGSGRGGRHVALDGSQHVPGRGQRVGPVPAARAGTRPRRCRSRSRRGG